MAGVVGARKPKVILHDAADQAEHLQEMQRLERRLELVLKDLRVLRTSLQRDVATQGVLGSRGLTQFIVETLRDSVIRHGANHGANVPWLLLQAEQAGYAIPLPRTMSKRLTERSYRVRDIAWNKEAECWYWCKTEDAE